MSFVHVCSPVPGQDLAHHVHTHMSHCHRPHPHPNHQPEQMCPRHLMYSTHHPGPRQCKSCPDAVDVLCYTPLADKFIDEKIHDIACSLT